MSDTLGIPQPDERLYLLYKQFAETLQAVTSLTSSIDQMHGEMKTHAIILSEFRSELGTFKERFVTLSRIVQGNGFAGESLFKTSVVHESKLSGLEEWKKGFKTDSDLKKTTNVGWITLIVTMIVTIALAIIVPLFLTK